MTRVLFGILRVLSFCRWIGVWAELLGDIIILSTAMFAVMGKDSLDIGLVGLSLSFAMQVDFVYFW
jgi:hypothetical protein